MAKAKKANRITIGLDIDAYNKLKSLSWLKSKTMSGIVVEIVNRSLKRKK